MVDLGDDSQNVEIFICLVRVQMFDDCLLRQHRPLLSGLPLSLQRTSWTRFFNDINRRYLAEPYSSGCTTLAMFLMFSSFRFLFIEIPQAFL